MRVENFLGMVGAPQAAATQRGSQAAPAEAAKVPAAPYPGAPWVTRKQDDSNSNSDTGTSAGTVVLYLLAGALAVGGIWSAYNWQKKVEHGAKMNPTGRLAVTQKDLDGIKILFRAPDTLALYGIPYKMRQGQQPGDLWRAAHDADLMSRTRPGYNPLKGWVWLGQPGWWGHMSDKEETLIEDFLRSKVIPDRAYEWAEIGKTSVDTKYDNAD